jgi:hypothetical protein
VQGQRLGVGDGLFVIRATSTVKPQTTISHTLNSCKIYKYTLLCL